MGKRNKHLAQTPMFWVSIILPIGIGIILGIVIATGTDLGQACASSQCIQNFMDHFKFPIAIMGLSIPCVAIWAAVHRSIENSVQIEEVIKNNRFGNYLKHREGFDKLIENWAARFEASEAPLVMQSSIIYTSLFPHSGFQSIDWYGQPDIDFVDVLNERVEILMGRLSAREFDFDKYFMALSQLFVLLGINFKRYHPVFLKSDDDVLLFVPAGLKVEEGLVKLTVLCLSLVELVRTYIGINRSDDISFGGYVPKLIGEIERAVDRYEVMNVVGQG